MKKEVHVGTCRCLNFKHVVTSVWTDKINLYWKDLNSFVALLHHDQCTNNIVRYKVKNVLYMERHKPLGPVAESPFLSLSASV